MSDNELNLTLIKEALSKVNDPAEAAVTIGQAAAEALSKIGRRNAA